MLRLLDVAAPTIGDMIEGNIDFIISFLIGLAIGILLGAVIIKIINNKKSNK